MTVLRTGLRTGLRALALALTASSAIAQPSPTLLWSAPGVENVVSIVATPDIDNDGRPDVVFESFDSGAPATEHLFAISGASSGSGTVLWSARPLGGPSNSGGYGDNCLRLGGDLDGDGAFDLLYGSAWGGRSAYRLDLTTGATVWSFDSYVDSPPTPAESGWVYAVEPLGDDVNGDGVDDVIFCLGSENNSVYCASGADGAILWRRPGLDAFYDARSVDDLNDDGRRDVIVAKGDGDSGVSALSGANGAILWSRSFGACQSVAVMPDLTADGKPEIVAAAWDNNVRCLNGATGATIWTAIVNDFSMRVVVLGSETGGAAGDVTGDGIPEVAVGSWDNAARLYNGATGALVWRTPVGTLNGGDVWAIDRVADVTGDGIDDVCCGSFDTKVYLMDGVTGAIQWAYTTGNRVFTVRGVPDLDGNGSADVVAGAQKLTTGGICYALQGGAATTSVDSDDEGDSDDDNAPTAHVTLLSSSLGPASPNPFRDVTSWRLVTPSSAAGVDLSIFSADGRRVRTLLAGAPAIQTITIDWDGRDDLGRAAPAGVYLARLLTPGGEAIHRRVVRIR